MAFKRIAFWGSSSVYGTADTEGGYVGRFRHWFDHEYEYEGGLVYNLGIPGETSSKLCQRFPIEFDSRWPDLSVFQIGVNDAFRVGGVELPPQVSLEQFEKNLGSIITYIDGRSQILFILQYPITEEGNPRKTYDQKHLGYYIRSEVETYMHKMREIAKNNNVSCLDLWDEWIADDKYKQFVTRGDGIHLNEAGYSYIAQRLEEFIPHMVV
ncbi:hypothetical protein COY32_07240 [candidate division WWE3 bacterium CG_4_10_14_0_2_um_filter_41_14]|uniref:SGNH hydrolase-type esterase domain-containing protein n=1 Tax=candidate division WWE3 bacterium CG_4_10_14_0_2_um_filter_41_14 TaxID=1975072 RepID=A0A2M7TEK1_UNCKA|nr:MAG: hypothetical protein COY32_07240 [candidate division WWE3 bacterium CG_4_10_14_0_2_um_filter_41_14]